MINGQMGGRQAAMMMIPPSRMVQMPRLVDVPVLC